MKVELSEMEVSRLRGCLFFEALRHKEMSQHYKDQGYTGIAMSEAAEGWAIMTLREKFPLACDAPVREELVKKIKEKEEE